MTSARITDQTPGRAAALPQLEEGHRQRSDEKQASEGAMSTDQGPVGREKISQIDHCSASEDETV
jgi:hypothetical protein